MLNNIKTLFISVALIFSTALMAVPATLEEGKQYQVIQPSVLVNEEKGKVLVIEFFSYGCPHCASLEPFFAEWEKKKPANVIVKRVPVEFQPNWENLAKLYYTALSLEVVEKMNPLIFAAMQQGKDLSKEETAADLFAAHGIDKETFKKTYNSFTVNKDLNAGRLLTQQYKVTGVPLIVVDGRYKTNMGMTGGPQGVGKVLDGLVAKASEENAAAGAKVTEKPATP